MSSENDIAGPCNSCPGRLMQFRCMGRGERQGSGPKKKKGSPPDVRVWGGGESTSFSLIIWLLGGTSKGEAFVAPGTENGVGFVYCCRGIPLNSRAPPEAPNEKKAGTLSDCLPPLHIMFSFFLPSFLPFHLESPCTHVVSLCALSISRLVFFCFKLIGTKDSSRIAPTDSSRKR